MKRGDKVIVGVMGGTETCFGRVIKVGTDSNILVQFKVNVSDKKEIRIFSWAHKLVSPTRSGTKLEKRLSRLNLFATNKFTSPLSDEVWVTDEKGYTFLKTNLWKPRYEKRI